KRLDENCINFSSDTDQEVWMENVAVCDEKLMEAYLETGTVDEARVAALIAGRKIFPCYFGSALKMQGVEELLKGLGTYTRRNYGSSIRIIYVLSWRRHRNLQQGSYRK